MNKKCLAIVGTSVLVSGLAATGVNVAKSDADEVHGGTIRIEKQIEADFPTMTRITMARAVDQALKAIPGQVLKAELENENGFLVYGIDVVTNDRTVVDVKVDAGSGNILAVEWNNQDDEDRETGEAYDNPDRED